jgi:hypothetical protein
MGGQRHAPEASQRDLAPTAQGPESATWPVWTGAETSPPAGFDPQTVQPVVSSYTG